MKLLNKSIEGTADDEDEGVTPDTAIRAGLELLKVSEHACCERACPLVSSIFELRSSSSIGKYTRFSRHNLHTHACHRFVSRAQVLSFTHPTSFHSAETYESLLQCLKMEDDKVAEAAIQIFRNTGQKIESELPQIRSYGNICRHNLTVFVTPFFFFL